MRIVLIARDQPLRIASAVVRCFDFAEEVILLDLSNDDETQKLATKAGATVIRHTKGSDAPSIAASLNDHQTTDTTILIALDDKWSLSNLPRTVGLARQGHDLFIAFKHRTENTKTEDKILKTVTSDSYTYLEADIQFACASPEGLAAVASQSPSDRPADITQNIALRVVELDPKSQTHHRESLASASRFAQLFYWMLESRHPLILFGVPGIIFFLLGYEMFQEFASFQGPHDPVSLGVALAAFAATLIGVFSLTTSLILYVLGKQVDKMAMPD